MSAFVSTPRRNLWKGSRILFSIVPKNIYLSVALYSLVGTVLGLILILLSLHGSDTLAALGYVFLLPAYFLGKAGIEVSLADADHWAGNIAFVLLQLFYIMYWYFLAAISIG